MRAAVGTTNDRLSSPDGEEAVLLEARENHFLRPSANLVGRLCSATLTNRRLLLQEPISQRVIYETPIEQIAAIRSGPTTDEPSIEFDVTNDRGQLEPLILWFRDGGWVLGEATRGLEQSRWVATLTTLQEQQATASGLTTRRMGAPKPASRSADLEPIRKLLRANYDIVRPIGGGGMGLVFEGRDRKLDRPVAIKRLRPDLRMDRAERARFLEEARLSAALHHPFIVDIYAILEEGADIFLVFEFVAGRTLDEQLQESGPLTISALRGPLEQTCAALAYAHGCHVIHRDLKPSNIMVTSQGYAKVMDFGIAHQRQAAGESIDTSGTAPYMAPEQELGQSDRRSDIFSLGVTLYEVLTSTLPFSGPNFYLQKERQAFTPLLARAPHLPSTLAGAIDRCLRFDPEQRFQSVDAFVRAVQMT